MGRSVDWLDIYARYGREAVRAGVRSATAWRGQAAGVADSAREREEKDDRGAPGPVIGRTRSERAMTVLQDLFIPKFGVDARDPLCWRLRRYAGQWWVWSERSSRYLLVDEEVLHARVSRTLDSYYTERWNEKKQRLAWSPLAPTDNCVRDVLRAAIDIVGVSGGRMPCWLGPDVRPGGTPLDPDEDWLGERVRDGEIRPESVVAFVDGLLDTDSLAAGKPRMIAPSPLWFSASALDSGVDLALLAGVIADESKFGALCPAWLDFVGEMSDGNEPWIEALQRWMGYGMTSDTSQQRMLWLQGPPGAGKGTLARVMQACVGVENCASTTIKSLADKYGLAQFVGKLYAIIPEARVGHFTDAAEALNMILSITGEDAVPVEDKWQKRTTVRLTCRFVLIANEEPRLPDAAAAIIRRLLVLPCIKSFVGREDRGLLGRLMEEIPYIRLWSLAGLARLRADVSAGRAAFVQPAEGQTIIDEIEAASSPMRAFVRERCVVQPGSSVYTDCFRAHYAAWAKESGLNEDLPEPLIGRQLRAAIPGVARTNPVDDGHRRRRLYTGVRPLRGGELRGAGGDDPRTMEVVGRFDEWPQAASGGVFPAPFD